METLRGAGVEVGVMAAPIFPGITDCAKIIEACAPFASSITFDTLNLRAGNRDKILSFVKTLRPASRRSTAAYTRRATAPTGAS